MDLLRGYEYALVNYSEKKNVCVDKMLNTTLDKSSYWNTFGENREWMKKKVNCVWNECD